MKVLLAIDYTPSAEIVINEFLSRPWPDKTEVCVLNVVDLYKYYLSPEYIQPIEETEITQAKELVSTITDRLVKKGIAASYHVAKEYPITGIVDFAKEWNADLIMMGSHSHSALARFFLGSIAKGVIRHAHCSVEVIRETAKQENGSMKVILATDGSEYSVAAAQEVAARPWPAGTEFLVVSIAEYEIPAIDPWYAAAEAIQKANEEKSRIAERAAGTAAQILEATKLKIRREVMSGPAKPLIVDTAKDWGANLIVVGSHGRRGITRLLMGSVAESVAVGASCSVEVVRGRPADS
ncbi:MAG TPA: universal stress protein [Blastocatellia bacterium]|nr:universal stress protein [Blastocatellia bacterium]